MRLPLARVGYACRLSIVLKSADEAFSGVTRSCSQNLVWPFRRCGADHLQQEHPGEFRRRSMKLLTECERPEICNALLDICFFVKSSEILAC